MTTLLLRVSALTTLAAALPAQGTLDLLVTFSNPQVSVSNSGGTVLRFLQPNEICHLQRLTSPCVPSAEKWLPRSCAHVMAGDENADTDYWNPTIFGRIDALCTGIAPTPAIGPANARTVFWSVSAAMGNTYSLNPFRPGDVARIVRAGVLDGQVEYFMRQEQFNQALGLPPATPIDIDAIAWSPNYGVFFSLDADIAAVTACGPTLVRDGDVVCVPPTAINWTWDMRVAAVLPVSAEVVLTEAQIDARVVGAQVTNRMGACLTSAVDLESLDIDWSSPGFTIVSCAGTPLVVPDFLFSVETGTGASVLTTAGGGQIWTGLCAPTGTACGSGPTFGPQMGIQSAGLIGAPSYVNALCTTFTLRHVIEPQQHVQNVFPFGAPAGASGIDCGSPFLFNVALMEIVPPTIPGSFPAFPWSQLCFPDLYCPSVFVHFWPVFGPWGTFPMPAIPPLWQGKVLFQNVGFGANLELSTPAVVDVK
ncbi:MAG: hypothetical protein WAT39_20120 [Planctomycetota bacterium]